MIDRRLGLVLLTLCAPALLLASSCGRHKTAAVTGPEGVASRPGAAPSARGGKLTVCHTDELGVKSVIIIPEKAWAAHAVHGDVQLVDEDRDGWVTAENGCVPGGDCDDRNADVHPGGQEVCDGLDNDCDEQIDDRQAVIGTQTIDILRDPSRLSESAMGNLMADAMRARYSGVDAAITNSGGLRQDLLLTPPSGGEEPGEITCGEIFAVVPFGNRTVILTVTGAQLQQALVNGFQPTCNPAVPTGRSPQVSGLKVTFSCDGTTPVVVGMWKTPQGIGGPQIPIGPTDTVRLVTNDFMASGGDGYTVLQNGTNVVQAGETLMEVLLIYVAAHSPLAAVEEGRIVRQ